jgi:hypothetical protein
MLGLEGGLGSATLAQLDDLALGIESVDRLKLSGLVSFRDGNRGDRGESETRMKENRLLPNKEAEALRDNSRKELPVSGARALAGAGIEEATLLLSSKRFSSGCRFNRNTGEPYIPDIFLPKNEDPLRLILRSRNDCFLFPAFCSQVKTSYRSEFACELRYSRISVIDPFMC